MKERRRQPVTAEYRAWNNMKSRCLNPNVKEFHSYGGRGITICERWMTSFQNFLTDMGPRPSDEHSIERKDVNESYEPANCLWATKAQQSRNKRNTKYATYRGETKPLVQWAEETGIPMKTLWARLNMGWNIDRVFERPVNNAPMPTERRKSFKLTADEVSEIKRSTQSSADLGKRFGVHKSTVQAIKNGLTWSHVD